MPTTILLQDTNKRQKIKIILALGIPAVIENFLQTIVGFVDALFVSKLGLSEVAAVGVSNAIIAIYLAIFLALGVGTSSLIAKSIGSGNHERANAIAKQSTILSILAGLLVGVITLFFAESLLRLMGAEAEVIKDGALYLRIVGIPAVFISLMTVFGSILRAAGDTKTPMKIGIWVNLIHVILGFVFIFGLFGYGGWGIAGAAYATVIVRIIGSVALFMYIQKTSLAFKLRTKSSDLTFPLLKISGPAAVERLIMRTGQVLYFGMIISIGTKVYAAHSIAGSIEIFSYMPGYGFAIAATTLVGQQLGAGRNRDAYQYGILSAGIAVIFMSCIGILLFVFSPLAASWFTGEADVINMVTTALRIDAFAQPFLAIGLVITGALQGAGDTKSPMYSTAIGMWLIRVLGVYILSVHFNMGISGVWLSMAIDLFIRAIFLLYRFHRIFNREIAIIQKA
ncbi:MATE family efflux transporter [Paenibacillus sp. FSL A5-0031]|uniref:MATE family efflux transporter n=1 Tax=Paenibacillus sp. FSL A5-0031 TaxID=1920420 RepID=UPI00096C5CE3|nr:MATE family efflux transporter [Paenibacillus sp. FSL A5-0031]OME75915.1 MATE family efflux transporter [Paenibacillus sp. FSL A5-0031]